MPFTPTQITYLPVAGFTQAQVPLLHYIHTMRSFDDAPFSRSAFSPANISERMALEISEERRPVVDSIFLSAASLVARTVKQERALSGVLGGAWREESRFVPAVETELAQLREAIDASRTELKVWRVALKGYKFDGLEVCEAFDLSLEEPLGSLLHSLQSAFLYRIHNAREILADYGDTSLAGIEAYFGLARQRTSGPMAKIPEDLIKGTGKL